MYDHDSKGISYIAGFFMLIAFAIAGLFLASLVSIPVWEAMTGKGFEAMKEGMNDPANSQVMKIIQSITAIVGFLLPTLVTALLLSRRPLKLLGFYSSTPTKSGQVGLVILMMLLALLITTSLSWFTNHIPLSDGLRFRFEKMEREYNTQVQAIIGLKDVGDYLLALVVMGFLPALCEEAFFRGGLQNFLTRGTKRPWLSIALVSILFSLAHISFYGFLPRFFLGLVLGGIYYYSGKLWLNILAHFINNALAITLLFYYTQKGMRLEDAMRENNGSFWGILLLPLIIWLFFLFKRAGAAHRRTE